MSKVVVLKDDCGRRFTMFVPDNTEEAVCVKDAGPLDGIDSSFKINGYEFSKRDLAGMLIGLIDDERKIAAVKLMMAVTNLGLKDCKDIVDELNKGNYCPQDLED